MLQQPLPKSAAPRQPLDLLRREMQAFEKVQRLFEPSGDQKAAPGRKVANEKLENRGLRLAVIQVRLDHIELVEIGQQRTRGVIHSDTLAQRNVRSPQNIELSHYPPIRRRELRNINAARLTQRHQVLSNSGVSNAETEV
jgi:hypothetical protein